MRQELVAVKNELGRGGALCKEFNKVRLNENQNWRVEMFYALEAIEQSDQLQRCEPHTIGRCIIDVGTLGLSLSPAKKEAYLIPYRIKVGPGRHVDQCSLSISYMGMEQIAYRTGFVSLIQTVLVREGDVFEMWTDDKGRHVRHQELSDGGRVTHAYTMVKLSSGETFIEKMTRRELDACREAAANKNGGKIPWTWQGEFRGEMYKKACLRRAWKHIPRGQNPHLTAMLEAVERTDPMSFQEEDRVVEESPYIDGDMIDELRGIMDEAGFPPAGHDAQLAGLARAMGYQKGIRHMLRKDFSAAVEKLKEGLERWQSSRASNESASEPENTSAPAEAT